MLEQSDPLLECDIFHRVIEKCVINRVALELMAVIMNDTAKGVVAFWYRSTWDCVEFAR